MRTGYSYSSAVRPGMPGTGSLMYSRSSMPDPTRIISVNEAIPEFARKIAKTVARPRSTKYGNMRPVGHFGRSFSCPCGCGAYKGKDCKSGWKTMKEVYRSKRYSRKYFSGLAPKRKASASAYFSASDYGSQEERVKRGKKTKKTEKNVRLKKKEELYEDELFLDVGEENEASEDNVVNRISGMIENMITNAMSLDRFLCYGE